MKLFCCIPVMLLVYSVSVFGQAKRVAVYDFDSKAVAGDVGQIFGGDKLIGNQVANRLIAKLVNSRSIQFDVIDRNQIDHLLKEQNLQFSDRFDPKDAPKLGKLLNVDAIVTGSIESMNLVKEDKASALGNIFGTRVPGVGLGSTVFSAEVTVSVRVISTETARIFLSETSTKVEKRSSGTSIRSNTSGSSSKIDSSHPGAGPTIAALQAAADELANRIVAKGSELPSRQQRASDSGPISKAILPTPSTPGPLVPPATAAIRVGRVEGDKIFITAGENAGLKVDDYLEVRRKSGTMKDDLGNNIETDERIGVIVITDVQERFAIAANAQGGPVTAQQGDKLKITKAPMKRAK